MGSETTTDGEILSAKDARLLLEQHLGMSISSNTAKQFMAMLPGILERFSSDQLKKDPMQITEKVVEGVGAPAVEHIDADGAAPLLLALTGGGVDVGRVKEALKDPKVRHAIGQALGVRQIRNTGARVGRNDPCPCGCGKKFKNCSMKASKISTNAATPQS